MEFLNQNTRASPSVVMRVAIVFAVIGCTIAKAASASDDDYLFCYASDHKEKVWYFSEIFIGDYFYQSTRAELDFYSALIDSGFKLSYPVRCTYQLTYRQAELKLERYALERQRYPFHDWSIVHTNWIPKFARPLSPSKSDDSYGRESGGDGCYFGECPDGVSPSPNTPSQ